jgi:threonine/homoserine/homoserine lactone efflux protein
MLAPTRGCDVRVIQNVFAFSVVSLTLAITPGPDSLIVIRHSLRAGTRGGIDATLGASFGSLVWGIVSVAGLAAVLDASAEAYRGLRIAGAIWRFIGGVQAC